MYEELVETDNEFVRHEHPPFEGVTPSLLRKPQQIHFTIFLIHYHLYREVIRSILEQAMVYKTVIVTCFVLGEKLKGFSR